jgi:hypothetical protein
LTEEEMKSIKGGTQNRGMFAVSGKSDAWFELIILMFCNYFFWSNYEKRKTWDFGKWNKRNGSFRKNF